MGLMPRCVGTCRDGSQCGRRVTDGSHPPLCHLHRAKPTLSPLIPRPEDLDPIKLLRQLTRDRDSRVKIRALDLLLKREATIKDCPVCAARGADEGERRFRADCVSRMTDEQIAHASALLREGQATIAKAIDVIKSAATQPIADRSILNE